MKKVIIGIVIAAVVLAIIGAVLVFGNFLPKEPKLAVTEAAVNTLNEFLADFENLPVTFQENMMSRAYKADFSLGLNDLTGTYITEGAEPAMIAAMKMFTLRDSMRCDPVNKKREDRLSLQLAVTPLAELMAYADPEKVAVSAPIAFDYYITADPEHFPTAWNNSIAGQTLGQLQDGPMEKTIYDAFMSLWFPEPSQISEENFDLELYKRILGGDTEYTHMGREKLTDGAWEKNCDVYGVTFTAETLQTLLDTVTADLLTLNALPDEVTGGYIDRLVNGTKPLAAGDVTLRVYVARNKVAGIKLKLGTEAIETLVFFEGGEINLSTVHAFNESGEGSMDILLNTELKDKIASSGAIDFNFGGAQAADITWDIKWDNNVTSGENYTLEILSNIGGSGIKITANGLMVIDDEKYDAQFDHIVIASTMPDMEMELDFSAGLTVSPDSEPIELTGEEKELTAVTAEDLGAMYMKLLSDQQLSSMLGQIVP